MSTSCGWIRSGHLTPRSAWRGTILRGRYLVYSPAEEPEYEDDWLLDIRLYSRSFRADRASIILQDLGLSSQHLREHLADRTKVL